MVILDVTVVNIALPSISKALSFSATDLQWVVTVYVLFTGGLMLLGGRSQPICSGVAACFSLVCLSSLPPLWPADLPGRPTR